MTDPARPRAFPTELAVRVAAAAIGYGFVALLARVLPPAQLGLVGALLSAALILGALSTFGRHLMVLRLGSGADVDGPALARLFSQADRGAALILAVGSVGAGVALLAVADLRQHGWAFLAALALVPLLNRAEMLAHLGRARGRILAGLSGRDLAWRPLAVLAVLLVPMMVPGLEVGAGLVMGLCAAALLAVLLAQQRILPPPRHAGAARSGTFPSAGPFWVVSVTGLILAMVDVVLAPIVLEPIAAGGYFVANRVATLAGMAALAQASAIGPVLAAAHRGGDVRSASPALRRIVRIGTGATVLVAGVLWLGAPMVLALFAPPYAASADALRVLLLAAVLAAALGPTDMILTMAGQERAAMTLCLVTLAVLPLLVPVAWIWGDMGLAAGIGMLVVLRKLAGCCLIRMRLGLRSDVLAGGGGA